MKKHVLDRPKTVSTARMMRAVTIERYNRPSLATLALQRRSRKRAAPLRAKYFTQFERGERP